MTQGKKVMQLAAVSASLAPRCRNSQKGINKLLEAVAADEEGLSALCCVYSENILSANSAPGPTPTHAV